MVYFLLLKGVHMIDAIVNADHTVTVIYMNERRTFDFYIIGNDLRVGNVFAGKFRTGNKLWPMSLTIWEKTGNVTVSQGGFSNKGGVRKVVGWWNKDSAANSRHKGSI
jgi:hypothetical protein